MQIWQLENEFRNFANRFKQEVDDVPGLSADTLGIVLSLSTSESAKYEFLSKNSSEKVVFRISQVEFYVPVMESWNTFYGESIPPSPPKFLASFK